MDRVDLEVLVVDDDALTRALVAETLAERGCRVRLAGSAQEAREALARARPDVLISDVGMPVEDGYALIRHVRGLAKEAGGDVPAIAFTAYVLADDRRHALACGFDAVVQKPLDASALLAAVLQAAGTTGRDPADTPPPGSPARDS